MCEFCTANASTSRIARRNVLKLAGFAAAGLAIAPRAFAKETKAPPKPENVLSPDAALDRLMKGNTRYIDGVTKRHDFKHERAVLSKWQKPVAAVLSHGACGAVDATIKSIKDGTTLPGHLPTLVAALRPAVEAVKDKPGDLLANAIRSNVMLTVDRLKSAAPILKAAADDKKIRVVGGVYELRTGRVELLS